MKKVLTVFLIVLVAANFLYAQRVERIWEKSATLGTNPVWNSGNVVRGMAYGVVGDSERVYLVDRTTFPKVLIFRAATGDSVGRLDTTGVVGGTFKMSDVEVSDNGKIFVCNLTTNATTSGFKVYRYENEAAAPTTVINYTHTTALRFGDKFTVVGSEIDNSIVIYAVGATANAVNSFTVLKFTTADNGVTYTPSEITVADQQSNSPAIGPIGLGASAFYLNYNGANAREYDAVTGTRLNEIPGSILGTGSNAIRVFETGSQRYVVSYQYGTTGSLENARVIYVPQSGNPDATSHVVTPSLGTVANGNGAGDVDLKNNGDGTLNVYVLGCNNGFGAYKVAFDEVTFQLDMSVQILKGFFNPATDSASISGAFNGWTPNAAGWIMADGNADSIYTLTKMLTGTPGTSFGFKWIMNGGYESGDNRNVTLTGAPQTLPVTYFSNDSVYVPPINVTFQVNMRVAILEQKFDPSLDVVRAVGEIQTPSWSPSTAPDMVDDNSDSIYVITYQVSPNKSYQYKYNIGTGWVGRDELGGQPNRSLTTGATDTVLAPVFFNNDSEVNPVGNGFIEFTVDMTVFDELGLFDNVNDSLQIRAGFNGWGDSDRPRSIMNQDAIDPNLYFLNVSFTKQPLSSDQAYKYFIKVADTANTWNDGYERPSSQGGGNRNVTFLGQPNQSVDAFYYDDIDPDWVIPNGTNLQVVFRVDMRPAADPNKQAVPFTPGVDSVWYIAEQPTFEFSQGWVDANPQRVLQLMDLDSDTIYTGTLTVNDPGFNAFMYRYAFTDVSENSWTYEPSGYSDWAYRVRYAGQNAARTFPMNPWTMPLDVWTNQEIKGVNDVDPFTAYTAVSVEQPITELPQEFRLYQNYPNPFNPSTTFRFDIAKQGIVKLVIFNILGQEVAVVANDVMKAGKHSITWNGIDHSGNRLASGVYLFKLETEQNVAVKKMVLLK